MRALVLGSEVQNITLNIIDVLFILEAGALAT